MNYKTSMFLQGLAGIFCGVIFLIVPEMVLDFVALEYGATAVLLLRALSLFVIILCAMLLIIRNIQDSITQRKILLANMVGDFVIALLFLFATMNEQLTSTGGLVLTLFMFVNAVSYVPAYWGLRGKG